MSAGTETSALAVGPITTDQRAIGCNLRFVQDNERRFGRALPAGKIQALMKR